MIRRGKDIKNVFFHDSKCGEIRYGGVKYFSVDEIWTENKTCFRSFASQRPAGFGRVCCWVC